MPLELRELIIQARIDASGTSGCNANEPQHDQLEELELKIFEAVMERLDERLAASQQR